MYFIKYQPLKNQLRCRSVTDREALPYLAIFAALTALVGAIPLTDGFNHWDAISAFFSVMLAIGGIIYAYHQNGGRTGNDLIQKYVILGWIVSFRFMLIVIPTMIILMIVGDLMGLVSLDSTGPFDVLGVFVFEAILYQRIGRHIRDTRNMSSEPTPHCAAQQYKV
jgi:hypothetical protein